MAEEKHDRHTIREVKTYVDEEFREIDEFTQVFGKTKTDPIYKGRALMNVGVRTPNGQVVHQQRSFDFEIPNATGIKKAFELFDEASEKKLEDMRKAAEEAQKANRIVSAKGIPQQGIVGPGGAPLSK